MSESLAGEAAFADLGQVRYLGDVQRLELRPGDIVVLRTPNCISMEAVKRLREYAEQALSDHKVLVLGDGLEIGVLGRAYAESDED